MIGTVYLNLLLRILTAFIKIIGIVVFIFNYPLPAIMLAITHRSMINTSIIDCIVLFPDNIAIWIITIVWKIEKLVLNIISYKVKLLLYFVCCLILYCVYTICINMSDFNTCLWYSMMDTILNSYIIQYDTGEYSIVYINQDPNDPDFLSNLSNNPGPGGGGPQPPTDIIASLLNGYEGGTREDFKQDPWISSFRPNITYVNDIYIKLMGQKDLYSQGIVSCHFYHPVYNGHGLAVTQQEIEVIHKIMSFSHYYRLRSDNVLIYTLGYNDPHYINCAKPSFTAKASDLFLNQFKVITQTLYYSDRPSLPKLLDPNLTPNTWNPVNISKNIPLTRLHALDVHPHVLQAHFVIAVCQVNDVVDMEVINRINTHDFSINNKRLWYRTITAQYEYDFRNFIRSDMRSGPDYRSIDRILMRSANRFFLTK